MANDSGNCEFTHLNQLAEKFGIHFNDDSKNHVQDHHFEQSALYITHDNPVLWTKSHEIVAAVVSAGKGTVFAVGDPWFYNEYTDGRKLPPAYKNYQAACDLTDWLISQTEKHTINYKKN